MHAHIATMVLLNSVSFYCRPFEQLNHSFILISQQPLKISMSQATYLTEDTLRKQQRKIEYVVVDHIDAQSYETIKYGVLCLF